MSKEKITYRFRYEDPYPIRKNIPYVQRLVQLVRVTQIGKNCTGYQVIGKMTASERDSLQALYGERFPLRRKVNGIRDNTQETIEGLISKLNSQY